MPSRIADDDHAVGASRAARSRGSEWPGRSPMVAQPRGDERGERRLGAAADREIADADHRPRQTAR